MEHKLLGLLRDALAEDCPDQDITSELMVPATQLGSASLIAKEAGIFYGSEIVTAIFKVLEAEVSVQFFKKNGAPIAKQDLICVLKGPRQVILRAERIILNFVQHLSGIATMTHQFVQALDQPRIQVLDTRKTTPLQRFLERRAVVAGGGFNHRLNLSDMVLIKENHLASFLNHSPPEKLGEKLRQFKEDHPGVGIEIEIETLEQLSTFDLSMVDVIMLDNFPLDSVSEAVQCCRDRGYSAKIEISGNISIETISLYKHLPIDRISIGKITHSAPALDLSFMIH